MQHWIGTTDVVYMLRVIGGWHVTSECHRENIPAVNWAELEGLVGRRIHYAPIIPEGVEAFELTDKGIERLREWEGDAVADRAIKMRDWYRQNTSTPPVIKAEES